jgi:GTPase KRas protein
MHTNSQHLSTLRTQYEPPEKEYAKWRVLLLGFNQVGKSAFLILYVCGIYAPDYEDEPMITEDLRKMIAVDELAYDLTITEFSTCLYSENPKLSADMHKRANGALLMFSIADRNTFEYIETLYQNVCEYRTYNFCMVLVGTKCDMEENREVTRQEAEEYAKKRRMIYIETSSKKRRNIDEPIKDLVRRIRQKNGFVDWDKLSSTIEKTEDKKCMKEKKCMMS